MNSDKVTHVTTGVRKILEVSALYQLVQSLAGGKKLRMKFVQEFIRPEANAKVLDIGCGPATILECLPQNVQYVGYDLNPSYIDNARKYYGSRGEFFCERAGSDISGKTAKNFDIVLASGIIHHLCDDEAVALVNTAWEMLRPGGTLVTLDTVYIENGHWFGKWVTSMDRGQNTRTPQGYLKIANSKFTQVEGFVTSSVTRIPYYSLYIMRCTKV